MKDYILKNPYFVLFGLSGLTLITVYIAEYGFGLLPCQICWWQRYPWMILFVICGIAHYGLKRDQINRWGIFYLCLCVLLAGLSISVFHIGVEQHWWVGLDSCGQNNHNQQQADQISLENMLQQAQGTPPVLCDIPAFTLFGISFAGFNFILSLKVFMVMVYTKSKTQVF